MHIYIFTLYLYNRTDLRYLGTLTLKSYILFYYKVYEFFQEILNTIFFPA